MTKHKNEKIEDFYDYNTRKIIRALRVYFKPAYQQLILKIIPEMRKKTGKHHYKLYVDKKIESIYGTLEMDIEIKNDIIVFTNVTYNDLLVYGYAKGFKVYKGIIYRDEKDLMKIKIAEVLKN